MQHGQLKVTPDFFEEATASQGSDFCVIRFRTGRRTDSEQDKEIYAAYQAAMEKGIGSRGKVKIRYLSTGETQDVELSPKKLATRLGKYNEAMAGIQKSRFPHLPNDLDCPRCPHYFICPSVGDIRPIL